MPCNCGVCPECDWARTHFDELNQPVRSQLEQWLSIATSDQRNTVDEFTGLLDGTGDSGSMHSTLEACIKASSLEYVRQCLHTIEWAGGHGVTRCENGVVTEGVCSCTRQANKDRDEFWSNRMIESVTVFDKDYQAIKAELSSMQDAHAINVNTIEHRGKEIEKLTKERADLQSYIEAYEVRIATLQEMVKNAEKNVVVDACGGTRLKGLSETILNIIDYHEKCGDGIWCSALNELQDAVDKWGDK